MGFRHFPQLALGLGKSDVQYSFALGYTLQDELQSECGFPGAWIAFH